MLLAVVRCQHGNQGFDDGGGRVKLATALAFGADKLAEKVFVDLA